MKKLKNQEPEQIKIEGVTFRIKDKPVEEFKKFFDEWIENVVKEFDFLNNDREALIAINYLANSSEIYFNMVLESVKTVMSERKKNIDKIV